MDEREYLSQCVSITCTERASNSQDGLDKSNRLVTRKQKTVLPSQVDPIKHKPKQKTHS